MSIISVIFCALRGAWARAAGGPCCGVDWPSVMAVWVNEEAMKREVTENLLIGKDCNLQTIIK